MNKEDKLHSLVKSLTGPEKGYFKKHSNLHGSGEKKYLDLFDSLCGMKVYNEEAIENRFRKEKFIRQLAVAKNYLYHLVLESLEAYHRNNDLDVELRNMLNQAHLLYSKGLFGQCTSILKKIEKPAVLFEKFAVLYELSSIEKKLITLGSYSQAYDIDSLYNKIEYIQKSIYYLEMISYAQSKLFRAINLKGEARDKETYTEYNRISKKILALKEEEIECIRGKMALNFFLSIYHRSTTQNHELVKKHSERVIELLEHHRQFIKENPHNYIATLNMLAGALMHAGKFKGAMNVVEKVKQMKKFFPEIEFNVAHELVSFRVSYTLEMEIFLKSGDFSRVDNMLPGLLQGIEKFRLQMDDIAISTAYHNIACLMFGKKSYRKVIEWCNRAQEGLYKENLYVYSYSKLLQLITCYELKDEEFLPYLLKSTYRSLHKREVLYKTEQLLLDFLRMLIRKNITSEDEMLKLFASLRKRVADLISKDPLERRVLENFDFISWLDSKIEKKSFAEIIKRKADLE